MITDNKELYYCRRTARRAVSQNLVNCRNKLNNKSTTNRNNGVRGLQLIDQPRLVDCRIGVVNKLDHPLAAANFLKSGAWDKVPEGITLIFGDTQISL